jgi:hypothetical protein
MKYLNQIEELEEQIKCLRADLFESIPFKRSQAEQWDAIPDVDYDAWEKEVEEKLLHKENVLRGYLSLCK